MSSIFHNPDKTSLRRGKGFLWDLHEELQYEYHDVLTRLYAFDSDPNQVENLARLLYLLSTLSERIGEMHGQFDLKLLPNVPDELRALSRQYDDHLRELPASNVDARQFLMKSIQMVTTTEKHFQELNRIYFQSKTQLQKVMTILVHTDLLFQCSQSLFPAERMMVVAGRIQGNQISLGAGFDVTGEASLGHVRADPQKLAQALIAMSNADAHLAAWFHSHPGGGAGSTHPSNTDLRQHADWLRNYSPRLLSGIFVRDRHCRFWGSALENQEIETKFVGEGIESLKGENNVYHIGPA